MNSGMFEQVTKKNFKQWHSEGKFELVAAANITEDKLEKFMQQIPPEDCDVIPVSRLEMGKHEKCYIWSNGMWEYFVVISDMQGSEYTRGIYEDTGKRSTIIYRSK